MLQMLQMLQVEWRGWIHKHYRKLDTLGLLLFLALVPIEAMAQTSSLSGQIWLDLDSDETPIGEPGLLGVTVEVYDVSNTLQGSAITASDGIYSVSDLMAGAYYVRLDLSTLPSGLHASYESDGYADGEIPVDLLDGQQEANVNWGFYGLGSISGTVFEDIDGDGTIGTDEYGIEGASLTLTHPTYDFDFTTTSKASGGFYLGGFPTLQYTLAIDPATVPGYNAVSEPDAVIDHQTEVDLEPVQYITGVNFGFNGNAVIEGRIFYDLDPLNVLDPLDMGLVGVSMLLFDDQDNQIGATDAVAGGIFRFDNLIPATYKIWVDSSTLPFGMLHTFDPNGYLDRQETVTLTAGEVLTDMDFGFTGNTVVGGLVFLDLNGDGFQDIDENGLEDVGFTLTDLQTLETSQRFSNEYGGYAVENLYAGSYRVEIDPSTLPAGATPVSDRDGTLDHQTEVTTVYGEGIYDVNFGYNANGSLAGVIFFDADGDGAQGPDDEGMEFLLVELRDDYGNLITSTTTSYSGGFHFGNLDAGTYFVVVDSASIPQAAIRTYDPDGVFDDQTEVVLDTGEQRSGLDFGYLLNGTVFGGVFEDANGDGSPEGAEDGISDVRLMLFDDGGSLIDSVLTGLDGNYQFDDVVAGDYSVLVDASTLPAGYSQTFDTDGLETPGEVSFAVVAGEVAYGIIFGYQGPGGVYGGVLHDQDLSGNPSPDDMGIANVRVTLLDAQGDVVTDMLTGEYGDFYFDNLPPGDYSVALDPSTLPENHTQVWDYDGLETPHGAAFTVEAGLPVEDVTFGYQGPGGVYGGVFHDQDLSGNPSPDDMGIANVRVTLLDAQGDVVTDMLTGEYGDFYFDNLPPGDYSVALDPSTLPENHTQVWDYDGLETPHGAAFTVQAGLSVEDVTFGYQGPGGVYGGIYDDQDLDGNPSPADMGIANVRVTLLDAQGDVVTDMLTGEYGDFYFDNLPPGDYSVALDPSTLPENHTQVWDYDGLETPHGAAFTVQAGLSVEDVTFGYQGPGGVYGGIYDDQDLDGNPSPGDVGLANVRVALLGSQGDVVTDMLTDSNGGYYFDNLPPGAYSVELDPSTLPESYTQVWDYDGTVTPHSASFTVQAGLSVEDVTFGYVRPSTISGGVYDDLDASGTLESGELGWRGARIELRDTQGGLVAETYSDGYGLYVFESLASDSYVLVVDASTLPDEFLPTFDPDGTATPYEATVTVGLGLELSSVDFGFTQASDPDLIAHWTLDETNGGFAVDSSGEGNDGLWNNGTLPVAALFANGLSFDGQNDVVEVPASASLNNLSQLTMSVWVNYSSSNGWRSIIDKRDNGSDGFDLYLNESSQAFLRINDSTLAGSSVLSAGAWHHLAAVYDGSAMVLYVNGVQDASRISGAVAIDTLGPLLLGENYARGNSYFQGVLDDVRIYRRALSSTEVADLHAESSTVVDTVEPTLANGGPNGTLAAGTTQLDLVLTTGEDATCRYSQTPSVPFEEMTGSFGTAFGTSHSDSLDGLGVGSYNFYVRCEDLSGNHNNADYEISFHIAQEEDLSVGLLGHWSFDAGAGAVASDTSGYGHDGLLLNGPQWVAGQEGQALAFDGSDDAMTVASAPALDSMAALTLSAWIQHAPGTGWRSIIDKRDVANDGYDLYVSSSSRLFMRINNQTLQGSAVIDDGAWHHVVGIYDGNQLQLFVDGVLDGSKSASGLSINTWRGLRLGENWEQGNSYFAGAMDDVRIYGRALSSADVTALYQSLAQP